MNKFIKVALDAVEKSSKIINDSYGKKLDVVNKVQTGIKDFVTEVDKKVEKTITERLTASFPEHSIWGEEFGRINKSKEYVWVIDPIDGTKNFVRGLGQFAVSIGLIRNGIPYAGIIYNHLEKKALWAVKGQGAFSGRKKLTVSLVKDFSDCALALNFGKTEKARKMSLIAMKKVYKDIPIIRMPGSTAFSVFQMVQQKFDAIIDNGDFWDFAGSIVIIKEAGGMATTWNGKEITQDSEYVLWSNGVLHSRLIERLSGIVTRSGRR